MSDDVVGVVLVFLQEVVHSGEGNLVDVLVDFLFRHTDTAVADGDGSGLFVKFDANGQVAQFTLELARLGKGLHLLRGVDGVRHHLAQEDFVVRIEEFLDDRKDVFCRYSDITFLHNR